MTKWLPIKGHKNRYEVSDDGRVRTSGERSDGRKFPAKELKPWKQNGYQCVRLMGKFYYVHQLVLNTFVGHPIYNRECNHKNGVKDDNRLGNLEWVTRSENLKHAVRTGLKTKVGNPFKKGNIPWNKGKKGLQKAWNKGMDKEQQRIYLKENNLLPPKS